MSANDLVHQHIEAVAQQDADAFAALYAKEGIIHDPFLPEPLKGRTEIRAFMEGAFGAFPDMRWEQVGTAIDAGDRVAFVLACSGTNNGPFPRPDGEMPPTGRAMSYEAAVFWTLGPDGLVTEERSYWDSTGVAEQLGMSGR